jgi:hypothetical protein
MIRQRSAAIYIAVVRQRVIRLDSLEAGFEAYVHRINHL